MSKSIYEETLNLIENIDRNIPSTWLMGRDNLIKIKHTLEQAQKQEKLLRLYKKLSNIRYYLFNETDDNEGHRLMVEDHEICKQIKELENE